MSFYSFKIFDKQSDMGSTPNQSLQQNLNQVGFHNRKLNFLIPFKKHIGKI